MSDEQVQQTDLGPQAPQAPTLDQLVLFIDECITWYDAQMAIIGDIAASAPLESHSYRAITASNQVLSTINRHKSTLAKWELWGYKKGLGGKKMEMFSQYLDGMSIRTTVIIRSGGYGLT